MKSWLLSFPPLTDIAGRPASWACFSNWSPKTLSAVIMRTIPEVENASSIKYVRVFSEPVRAILIMLFLAIWARNRSIWKSHGRLLKIDLIFSRTSSLVGPAGAAGIIKTRWRAREEYVDTVNNVQHILHVMTGSQRVILEWQRESHGRVGKYDQAFPWHSLPACLMASL